MLLSLSSLVVALVSVSVNVLAGNDAQSVYAGNPSVTPRDPSSLVLALIGIGTLAAYAAVRRRPLRAGARHFADPLSDQPVAMELAECADEAPSRGAA